MHELLDSLIEILNQIDRIYLMPALGILPLFAFPASPLLMLIGYYYGPVYGMIVAMIGIAINDTLAYWVARSFLRGPLLRLLERRKIKVPAVPDEDEIRVIALLRITPGTPLFLQSYLLGLAKVSYWRYILVSVPIQALHAAGFVVFAGAIFEGSVGMIVFAVFLLIAIVIIFRMVHSHHKARAVASKTTT
ncbi:TVP38/TMEM64 family protein [Cerasicoccus arenae]|uniref:TVP38/TMEM64 family membrane protein n=2 Tax=Cerasicoccus arenae TaxID=424488 RepID=A0A8J3DCT0_9BACT|nr:VTT domain-containing protein [Cerasicoccus arenae]GHC06762.1 hypothetical protein GCM10007047_24750 [Cerasicoccus arenae]